MKDVSGAGKSEVNNSGIKELLGFLLDATPEYSFHARRETQHTEDNPKSRHSKKSPGEEQATILVVDDRELDLELLTDLLEPAGHRVLTATDGFQALEMAMSAHPDLIIADVLLPKLDGYQLVRQLHADPAVSGIKVIFYTAVFNEEEARDLAREIGVARILAKPTEPAKILQNVAEVLKDHEKRPDSASQCEFEQRHLQLLTNKLISQAKDFQRKEDVFRQHTAELEVANQELESFSYSVAHDLKVPIRTIEGYSKILSNEYAEKLDAEGLRLLKVVRDNTKVMYDLIDDLLALARLVRLPLNKKPVDLGGMATQVFERLRAETSNRKLQLIVKQLPEAFGDHSLLYQVMMNLLGNAIKFTGYKETAVIQVGGWTEGEENIYYVKDNGAGFDDRYISNLFRPFHRLHYCAEYEGTGIGLAIVQRIIHRHGGRVWAEGKVDEGATFFFALPRNGELLDQ